MEELKLSEDFYKKKYGKQWYNLRPILGCANWAWMYFLLGARECGKSYSVTNFLVDQFVNRGIPFTWLRLTDAQAQKLLTNNAERLVDPDIRRKYNLDLVTRGTNVYQVTRRSEPDKNGKTKVLEKKLMARVLSLSTFYTDKGSIFDKDFLKDLTMRYNVACDEFEREKNERNTFDILYALVNQLENLMRSTKERMKIFFMGNTLEEASDILAGLEFIPEKYGIYKLKAKHAVIHYIEPSEEYLKRRKGTLADILMPEASTFSNRIEQDTSLICKDRLVEPKYIIKFTKNKNDWFTVWQNNIIAKYNNEQKPIRAMRPYIDEMFNPDIQKQIIQLFDTRCFQFKDLVTFKLFQKQMQLLKPRA